MIAHCVYSLSLFPQYGHSGNFPCLCGSLKKNQENVTASPQSLAGGRLYRLQTGRGQAFCVCTLFFLGLKVHEDGGSPGWQEESRATHGVLSEELYAPVCTQRLSIILTGAHKALTLRDSPGARDTLAHSFVCQGGTVTGGLAELKWEQKLSLVLFFFYKKQM